MTAKVEMNPYRTTARVVGALFIAGMVIGIAGHMLVQSILGAPDHLSIVPAKGMLVAIGAMLMLMTVAGDAAHGVLMLPILRQRGERIAFGYFGFRIVDAVFLAVGVVFLLLQIPLGREYLKAGGADAFYLQALSTVAIQANLYAYNIAMTFLGVAGLMLCYVFYRAKLVPRLVAVWGLVGYAVILGGSVLEVMGFNLSSIHTIPGGLWELFIGVWLIARGFNSSAFALPAARTGIPAAPVVPSLHPAKP